MSILMIVVMALLFAALSPGVFLYLPPGASRRVAALVHGFVFAIVWYFLYDYIFKDSKIIEGKKNRIGASIGCALSGGKLCKGSY
jgi:hypothetical protein